MTPMRSADPPVHIPADERALLALLGPEQAAALAEVRSRRNRRQSYSRLLSEAQALQELFQPSEDEPAAGGDTRALRASLASQFDGPPHGLPIGVPTPRPIAEGQVIALDLRGQSPNRTTEALRLGAKRHADLESSLGLLITIGGATAEMVDQAVRRFCREFGRGQVFHPAELPGGLFLLLDEPRARELATTETAPVIPLAAEIAALESLLLIVGASTSEWIPPTIKQQIANLRPQDAPREEERVYQPARPVHRNDSGNGHRHGPRHDWRKSAGRGGGRRDGWGE